MERNAETSLRKVRHRLYGILEHGPIDNRIGRLIGQFIVTLIVIRCRRAMIAARIASDVG